MVRGLRRKKGGRKAGGKEGDRETERLSIRWSVCCWWAGVSHRGAQMCSRSPLERARGSSLRRACSSSSKLASLHGQLSASFLVILSGGILTSHDLEPNAIGADLLPCTFRGRPPGGPVFKHLRFSSVRCAALRSGPAWSGPVSRAIPFQRAQPSLPFPDGVLRLPLAVWHRSLHRCRSSDSHGGVR